MEIVLIRNNGLFNLETNPFDLNAFTRSIPHKNDISENKLLSLHKAAVSSLHSLAATS
jgi:hypothetical protein